MVGVYCSLNTVAGVQAKSEHLEHLKHKGTYFNYGLSFFLKLRTPRIGVHSSLNTVCWRSSRLWISRTSWTPQTQSYLFQSWPLFFPRTPNSCSRCSLFLEHCWQLFKNVLNTSNNSNRLWTPWTQGHLFENWTIFFPWTPNSYSKCSHVLEHCLLCSSSLWTP